MTEGSSQGLFVIVAVVIFGIFVLIAYMLFQDKLKLALASIFEDTTEQVQNNLLGVNDSGNNNPSLPEDNNEPDDNESNDNTEYINVSITNTIDSGYDTDFLSPEGLTNYVFFNVVNLQLYVVELNPPIDEYPKSPTSLKSDEFEKYLANFKVSMKDDGVDLIEGVDYFIEYDIYSKFFPMVRFINPNREKINSTNFEYTIDFDINVSELASDELKVYAIESFTVRLHHGNWGYEMSDNDRILF